MKPPPQDAGGAFSPKRSLKPPKDVERHAWKSSERRRAPGLPGVSGP